MLHIAGLSKRYANGVQALHNVTLAIPAGMFGLLGPNGAGKSTLMRTLATLQDVDEGTVRLGEIDVLANKSAVRRRLGYLPQEFGLYPRVPADELLDYLALLKGIGPSSTRRALVESLLRKTNLWDVRRRAVGTYSGGMRQRFGIAQALIGDPQLLIVDEPTAGLDPEERVRFHNLLSDISEQVVVILSTHIVDDVKDLCSQMAIMNRGEVIASGDPQVLTAQLNGKIWRKFITRDQIDVYRAKFRVLSTRRLGGRTSIRVEAPAAPELDFEPVTPELEDVYFRALYDHAAASGAPAEVPVSA